MRVESAHFVCDVCGKEYKEFAFGIVLGIVESEALTGKPTNGSGNCFDFCENCWDKFVQLFKSFKVEMAQKG